VTAWLLYLAILVVYMPGLWLTLRSPWMGRLPLVIAAFLGMFVLNAMGSILVLLAGESESGIVLPAAHLATMLIGQALIFYLIVVPYAFLRRDAKFRFRIEGFDYLAIPVLAIISIVIVLAYLSAVGQSLLVDLLMGELDQYSAGELRQQKFYGLPFFQYYQLGLFVLPAIVASSAFLLGLLRPEVRWRSYFVLASCFIPLILGGLKAGILELVVVLVMSHAIYLGAAGQPISRLFNWRFALVVVIALLPTIAIYSLYFRGDAQLGDIAWRFFYRVFGAYAETMAATAPFVDSYGWLDGTSMPKIMGLLSEPADHVGMDQAMHLFLTGFEGAAPVPAVGEGFANFGWWGFFGFSLLYSCTVIALQEFLLLLRGGILATAITAYFAYLSLKTAVLGIFATLLSPLNLAVILLLPLMRLCAAVVGLRSSEHRSAAG
jgi:hypothetical protein